MTLGISRRLIVATVGVLVVGALAFWWWTTRSTATPDTIEGWAMPNATGTAIALDGNGYIIAGARWSDTDNVWHEGSSSPTCVGTDTTARTHVELGIVDVDADFGSWQQVVWLRCVE